MDREVRDDVHLGHGVGERRILGSSENSSETSTHLVSGKYAQRLANVRIKPRFVARADGRRRVIFDAAEIDRLTARFWSKVDKSAGPDACHPWTGALAVNGYGQWHPYGGVHIPAHRFALILKLRRTLEPEEVTLHLCRTKACCNIEHLTVGSYADNHLHAALMGTLCTSGEGNPQAKLTDEQVIDLRRRAATEYRLGWLRDEGERLGVSGSILGLVVRGLLWPHLPGAVNFGHRQNSPRFPLLPAAAPLAASAGKLVQRCSVCGSTAHKAGNRWTGRTHVEGPVSP